VIRFVRRRLDATVDLSAPAFMGKSAASGVGRALLLLAGLYVSAAVIASSVSRAVPDSWERALFDSGEADPLFPEDVGRPAAVLSRLRAPGGLRHLRYRVVFVSYGEANAWVRPGGSIYVTADLLKRVKSEIGLAAVLAHELGHHERRHVLSRLSRSLFVGLPASMLLGRANLGAAGEPVRLAELAYERDQETAADEFALRQVRLAYGTTEGSLEFFEWIAKQPPGSSVATRFLRTHPLPADRLEYLRRLQASLDAAPTGDASAPALAPAR